MAEPHTFLLAAADFDPVGTHRFKDPRDRRCPHLFNLQLTISLSSNKPNFDLQLTFVDAVITDYTIVSPGKNFPSFSEHEGCFKSLTVLVF